MSNPKNIRFAVMGFRHGHIQGLIDAIAQHPDALQVGACEEDPETRERVRATVADVPFFDSYADLLKSVECDAIAVGDYYEKRGSIILEALRQGHHVLSDKPICTRLDELDAIENLTNQKTAMFP